MKLTEVTDSQYLFHVTYTRNVPNIKKKGLIQFQPSNWVRGDSDTRYNEDAGIFAFTDPEDATKWAFKMKFDMEDKDISIIRFDYSDDWEDDPSQDPILALTSKGRAVRSKMNIPAEKIIDAFEFNDFGTPVQHDMSQQEWLATISKQLLS